MLPFYELTINDDDETGVLANALVDEPAHMHDFIAFAKDKPKYYFEEQEEKRVVLGVMISANKPIYRLADEGAPEHYVVFKPETVAKIHRKFHKQGLGFAINEMHDSNKMIQEGVFMEQSYLIGGERNPSAPKVFENLNLQDGSWIASYVIENDEIWAKVKKGEFKGFSVEGIFERTQMSKKQKSNTMSKKKAGFLSAMSKAFAFLVDGEFAEVTTVDGDNLKWEGDIAVGTPVFVVQEDGTELPAPAESEYAFELDGVNWTITIDENGTVGTMEEVTIDEEEPEFSEEDPVNGGDFKAFMEAFTKDVDTRIEKATKEANDKVSKFETENEALKKRVNQLESFNKSKFNHEPPPSSDGKKKKGWVDLVK